MIKCEMATDELQKTLNEYELLEGMGISFIRAFAKLPKESKKKLYDYIKMVDSIEKKKQNKTTQDRWGH